MSGHCIRPDTSGRAVGPPWLRRFCMPNPSADCLDLRQAAGDVTGVTIAGISADRQPFLPDSRQAWIRLAMALLIGAIGVMLGFPLADPIRWPTRIR